MFFIHVIFIAMNIFWLVEASEYRRYIDIDVKLIGENDGTFETKIHEMIELSERYHLANKIADGFIDFAGSYNESLERAGVIVRFMKDLTLIANDIIETLVSEIPIEMERANLRQDIINMGAKVKTIIFNIRYLNGLPNIGNDLQKAIIHDIHNDLFEIVNMLDHHDSVFKKHPLAAVPMLFSLASFIAVYNRMAALLNPELVKRSLIGCKLQQVLKEFLPIVTIDRLTKMKVLSTFIPANDFSYGYCKYS